MTQWTPQSLIDAGALVVVNHSGGKDSQATLIEILKTVPRKQIVIIHATLGEFEWHGAKELAEKQARDAGLPFVVAHAFWKDGSGKDFLGMVAKRKADRPEVPSWPAGEQRYCTSDLKRDPINREIRRYIKRHKLSGLILNVEGIRGAESDERAKYEPFHVNERLNGENGRIAYTWYPIFDLSTAEVFQIIRQAGQEPHPAYALGNERLSCVFCIYGKPTDLANGKRFRPELFDRYVEMEASTGYTMHMSRKSLVELVAEGEAIFARLAAKAA